jgi:hypothetical protein
VVVPGDLRAVGQGLGRRHITKEEIMKRPVIAMVIALGSAALAAAAPTAAAPPPGQADCVAQYVSDFQALFPDFTIGDVQGHLGEAIPGYPGGGGQAHYLQPFGVLLKGQATGAPDACPYDLSP